MCLECGTALNLSRAPVAEREREFIRREITRGRTKEQIKAALVERLGPAVLALPENEGFNLAAYLVPLLAALAGAAACRRRPPLAPPPAAAAPPRSTRPTSGAWSVSSTPTTGGRRDPSLRRTELSHATGTPSSRPFRRHPFGGISRGAGE